MSYENVIICDRCGKEEILKRSRREGVLFERPKGWRTIEFEHGIDTVCPECSSELKVLTKGKALESAEK